MARTTTRGPIPAAAQRAVKDRVKDVIDAIKDIADAIAELLLPGPAPVPVPARPRPTRWSQRAR